ncbi:NAD-dependent epimerase/dehydratase family protein [Kitasatospora sp. NBC_01266]|uniref:NAD-dependent epimerase/dehydratase family protein n=1 Tax=Kitasatospora sp. NBC_01266 TaxID=2903572 RepID=UPI002E36C4EE|nr:NAD(P)-dependent oxidoreductase [Kitasatospora sp. NBC_01266]
MRVLVVGGTGFLGHHVMARLTERGHRTATLTRTPGPATGPAADTVRGDATLLTEDDWARLLDGQDGVVFAAGADDRTVPRRPAAAYFEAANVEPDRRLIGAARRVGVSRAVILGSYFTAFHRQWPELELAARHPYIGSRIAQAEVARAVAGPALPVAVLEIPFVFGATPGRRPLWAGLVPWLMSPRAPLLAPPGGTAAVTVDSVAAAAVSALEDGLGVDLPVADTNMTWRQLLVRFARAAERPGPARVGALPTGLLRAGVRAAGLGHRLRGLEPGLAPRHLVELLTRELYLEPTGTGDLDEALRDTVRASLKPGAASR